MPGDIFGLRTNSSKLYDKQVDNTWPESANYGYLAGGEDPGVFNTIYRIDFSNETVSAPEKNLPLGKSSLTAISNSNYGYFAGGYSAPPVVYRCTIDRLDFSNETVAVPPVDNQLTKARSSLAAVSSSNYGYFGGGFFTPPATRYSIIDRIDFSSETVSAPPGLSGSELNPGRNTLGGVSNSKYGYFVGGYGSSYIANIDRIDFSNETVVGPPIHQANLTQARGNLATVSTSDYGYFGGGTTPSVVNTIDRIDFSNEIVSLSSQSLPGVSRQLAAVSNLKYGYFCGGSNGVSTINTISRIDFSNETTSSPGNNLTAVRKSLAGVSGKQTRIRRTTDKTGSSVSGYGFYLLNGFPSGNAPGQRNIIDYATETQTTPPIDIIGTQFPSASIFTSIDYGYQVKTGTTTLDRFEFKNDTRIALDKLSEAQDGNSFSNNHYGYSCRYLETDGNRYDKSTDTDISIANIISVSNTRYPGGYSNFSSPYYGWFSMGQTPGPTGNRASIIDRLEFSTETSSSAPVGTSYRRWGACGGKDLVGSYGYVFGGNTNYVGTYKNTADKFDMETETFSPAGTYCPSTTGRMDMGTIGLSKHYGYIGPGYRPPTTLNRMDRYEFSTNTSTTPSTTMSSPSVRGCHCFPSDIAV